MKTALTIAGSDSSGGAGIQADIKTMQANAVFGMSVITALTAQNTLGVNAIFEVSKEFVGKQIEAVFEDIRPDAVKIGMLANSEIIEIVADKLLKYKADNIVLDPVMISTSGSKLIADEAIAVLKEKLLPIANLITPNIPEAIELSQSTIENKEDMERVAKMLGERYNTAVLIKGGHNINDADDVLFYDGKIKWFYGQRVDNKNTHGTGCTLSSAIVSNLAKGYGMEKAIESAKRYISLALLDMLDLGKGRGPMNHGFSIKGDFSI